MICVITVGTKINIIRRLYMWGDDGWAFEFFLFFFSFFSGFLIKVEDGNRVDCGFMVERNGGMVGGGVMIREGTGRRRRRL